MNILQHCKELPVTDELISWNLIKISDRGAFIVLPVPLTNEFIVTRDLLVIVFHECFVPAGEPIPWRHVPDDRISFGHTLS